MSQFAPNPEDASKKRMNPQLFNAIIADDTLRTMKDIKDLLLSQKAQGFDYSMTLHLLANAQVTKIDFEDDSNTKNLPAGDRLYVPHMPVLSLTIRNDGPGDVYFGLNKGVNDWTASSLLTGAFHESITISNPYPTVEAINLRATTNSTCRLIMIV